MAGSASSSFAVTATVVAACKINSASAIAFGNYDPAVANATASKDAQGTVQIVCTKSAVAVVSMDQGINPGTGSTCSAPSRQMNSGTSKLAYGIYQDLAHGTPWGCTSGTNTLQFTATGAATPNNFTTFGSVPGGQDLPAGSYSDTVTVSVTF